MDGTPDWLPELELFSDYGGDWNSTLVRFTKSSVGILWTPSRSSGDSVWR